MKTRPGHERICTLASAQGHATSEPCDRAVRRSARRLNLLGSRASASRLPGSARPTDGGNRLAGGDARAFFAVELPSCVRLGAVRDEQDGRSDDDRQLGRTSPDGSLLNVFGGLCVLGAVFFFGFCW